MYRPCLILILITALCGCTSLCPRKHLIELRCSSATATFETNGTSVYFLFTVDLAGRSPDGRTTIFPLRRELFRMQSDTNLVDCIGEFTVSRSTTQESKSLTLGTNWQTFRTAVTPNCFLDK